MFGSTKKKLQHRALEDALGYRFKKRYLLEMALVHRSYRFENEEVAMDNQRLEFLGDAVLDFLAAAYLYERLGDKDEGVLTSLRSQTTSGKALAQVARGVDLGAHLLVGRGEEQTGGRQRESNLADALEAVMGAAFSDGGLKAARKVFEKLFVPHIEGLSGDVWAHNPKGKLQEYAQRRWKASPRYQVVSREGKAHAAIFTATVTVNGADIEGHGRGRNKQDAETKAAADLLRRAGV